MSNDIRCYSLDVDSTEFYDKDNLKTDKMYLTSIILKEHNCLGFHTETMSGIQHCLFKSVDDRYEAYRDMKDKNINCKLNPLTVWVNEKYLNKKPLKK